MTIKNVLLKSIADLKDNKTVYVLKGFNYWLNDIDGNFLFSKRPIIDTQPDITEITSKLSKGGSLFALHEDIAWLSSKSLGGLPQVHGYSIVLVENDLFSTYFPNESSVNNNLALQSAFDKETDNIVQLYYGDVREYENISYIAYNDLNNIDFTEIKLSKLMRNTGAEIHKSGFSVDIPEEYDAVAFSSAVVTVIENDAGSISVLVDKINTDKNIVRLKSILGPLGIRFTSRDYNTTRSVIDETRLAVYLEILQRKNKNYLFKNIKVYEDPYEGSELAEVNQAQIIDDIVDNAIKAQEGKDIRDVFTTAPTGAGKSVMFQIPAIYLAEKHELLTIVVSPLIGLMNDQVNNIEAMSKMAATINSDYTPVEKENTLDRVKSGEVSILYLSPESLLSNTDITNLIGERKIGLIVVDEAHIVATWGKSFRPDYWYLGEFISRLRNGAKSQHKFPIVTFTATATFGGSDNMYLEIIESLKMTPVKYIGNVKRDNITFDIRPRIKDHAYKEEKLELAARSINSLVEEDAKSLVYVPYTRHISEIYEKIEHQDKVGKYSGGMTAGEKRDTLKSIKDGTKNLVLATKAFGMGIDIDDIKNVYHFAPTGNVADYVQEIGRVARKPDMTGVASTDFFKEDFRYIKQLFGMSSIKNYQVKATLQKIFELYTRYNKRNFLVSPDEFSHIFADKQPDDVDSKLKTTLLIIKKDFDLNPYLNYAPLIFKPRSMFTFGYFMINDKFIDSLQNNGMLKFFKKLDLPRTVEDPDKYGKIVTTRSPGDTYRLDFKSMWEQKYRDVSFGLFKRNFYNGDLSGFDFRITGDERMLVSRVVLEINSNDKPFGLVKSELFSFLDVLIDVFSDIKQSGKHFTTEELAKRILDKQGVSKKHIADIVGASILYLLERVTYGQNLFNNNRFFDYNSQTNKYVIKSVAYENLIRSLKRTARSMLADDNKTKVVRYSTKLKDDQQVIMCQLLQLLEIADCKISSGSKPEFFVRVNNPYAIERIVNNSSYTSKTVELVADKHKESYELMGHFFEKLTSDTERWDFIERYFLGRLEVDDYDDTHNS